MQGLQFRYWEQSVIYAMVGISSPGLAFSKYECVTGTNIRLNMQGWAFRHWKEHSVIYAMVGILHGRTVDKICKGELFVTGDEHRLNMQGWTFNYWDKLSVKYARVGISLLGRSFCKICKD